jgi:hypothetical protein
MHVYRSVDSCMNSAVPCVVGVLALLWEGRLVLFKQLNAITWKFDCEDLPQRRTAISSTVIIGPSEHRRSVGGQHRNLLDLVSIPQTVMLGQIDTTVRDVALTLILRTDIPWFGHVT